MKINHLYIELFSALSVVACKDDNNDNISAGSPSNPSVTTTSVETKGALGSTDNGADAIGFLLVKFL